MPISEGVDFLGFRFYLTGTGKVIWRLRNKVMGSFVLTHAPKNKEGVMAYDNMKGSQS